jgi:kinesin family protein 1
MSECLVYQLKPGTTVAGSPEESTAHIKLSDSNIQSRHCIFNNEDGVVTLEITEDARTFVNGKRVQPSSPVQLFNGYRVILGDFHVFRYNDPAAVRKQRQKMATSHSIGDMTPITRSDTPLRGDEMDWTAARREMADIEKLGDQDLDQLYDNIVSGCMSLADERCKCAVSGKSLRAGYTLPPMSNPAS